MSKETQKSPRSTTESDLTLQRVVETGSATARRRLRPRRRPAPRIPVRPQTTQPTG